MKQVSDFARLLSGFLNNYLPHEKGVSANTIKSYTYTFILFIRYMRMIKNVPVTRLSFTHLNKDLVVKFLDWLQHERGCCEATRNQRLAVISSFIQYAEYMTPGHLFDCHQILSIPAKKTESKVMSYLTIEGMKLLLQQPDTQKVKGLRNLALLSLMYESAARVQEIIDLTPASLFITNKPYRVILHGKGNKYRTIPLPDKQVELLRKYMTQSCLLNRENVQKPLFPNYQGQKMTRNGVNNILVKYVKIANKKNPSLVPDRLSCHAIRHSKAMFLLESKVELMHIRDFLGHKSVLSTEIYARMNPKYTFEAVKNAYKNITTDNIPVWKDNNELMVMLKNLTK
ncbi:MAG: tyrosine-type recombinase/integrase [Bacteroidales bacterium]|jgi:integrase/recombinase XerD|nr:tyrosine-type recombinase/integrase [Bacteroidales bacterium]